MDSLVSSKRKKRRPNFSSEFRQSLAQQACAPGVSVSQLAQTNDVNVNMLFKWRRQLVAGLFDKPSPAQAMLPVTIVETATIKSPVVTAKRETNRAKAPLADVSIARQGVIEIQIAEATVRFDGHADLATLRAVVRMLRA
ncbi:MAG: transposase [Herminiimonas sp.]|nr:transposase [Herminiimonas sp.]